MERDVRRDRGQWRGCHTFQDIVCDGDKIHSHKRSGGLKMGQTYYYYYEVDGSTDTYDPTLPTTNNCPYLPGQTVNTLDVPMEQPSRRRSASLNSLRTTDFMTMDPRDKFTSPRPAPPVPGSSAPRIATSPGLPLHHARSASSLTSSPSWARRFFGGLRSASRGRKRARGPDTGDEKIVRSVTSSPGNGSRSTTPLSGGRTRDLSPESLRKFLSDEMSAAPAPLEQVPRQLEIPEEIVEENEDDENFATSAVSEGGPTTTLSPPPFQRTFSSHSTADSTNESKVTIVPCGTSEDQNISTDSSMSSLKLNIPQSHFSFSTISSQASSASPDLLDSQEPTHFSVLPESNSEDEDGFSTNDEDNSHLDGFHNDMRGPRQPLGNYSLPSTNSSGLSKGRLGARTPVNTLGSPVFVARNDCGLPFGNTNLLGRPGFDTGLDDLVTDLGWMADVIRPKEH